MTATTATSPVNAKQQAVLDDIAANGGGTAGQIAERMGVMVSQKSVQQLASSLLRKGLVVKEGMTYSLPVAEEANEAPLLADAIAAARARIEAGAALEITPSGKVAKMVRITLDIRVSTDGRWIVAKTGEGDAAWTLYRVVTTGRFPIRTVATFPTCTAAFAPANLTA